MHSLRWRSVIVVMALLACVVCLAPNIPGLPSSLSSRLPSTAVKLGLDLRGGINLTLGVDVDKALSNALLLLGQDIRAEAAQNGLSVLSPRLNAAGALELTLPKEEQAAAF
ncbi:MAG: protein translocase subunit SecD, partial [Desulfovibrionaceae bacterium]|nr:protein translocase subunit SecD [Desulfovibrionaceae bacterium]